jgi:hypothetical protein
MHHLAVGRTAAVITEGDGFGRTAAEVHDGVGPGRAGIPVVRLANRIAIEIHIRPASVQPVKAGGISVGAFMQANPPAVGASLSRGRWFALCPRGAVSYLVARKSHPLVPPSGSARYPWCDRRQAAALGSTLTAWRLLGTGARKRRRGGAVRHFADAEPGVIPNLSSPEMPARRHGIAGRDHSEKGRMRLADDEEKSRPKPIVERHLPLFLSTDTATMVGFRHRRHCPVDVACLPVHGKNGAELVMPRAPPSPRAR